MGAGIKPVITLNRFPSLPAAATRRASQVVRKTALEIEAEAKASMARVKHGEVYGGHQASAPGEAPAIDTTALANSITPTFSADGLTAVIGSNSDHAVITEYGTARMAPRPWLTPAAEGQRKAFVAAMKQVVE